MLTEKQKIDFLKKSFLFYQISEKGLNFLVKYTFEKKYEKNEIIFNEGEKGDCLYIITSGKVKIIKTDKNGKEKILAILKEKDCFGEMAVLTKELRTATVQALTDVEILCLNADDFETIIKNEPSIPIYIIKTLAERLAKADRQIKNLAFGNASERIADVLYDLAENSKINITHQELANIAGLTRETTTRILTDFKKQGIIDIKRGHIEIKNMSKIKQMIM